MLEDGGTEEPELGVLEAGGADDPELGAPGVLEVSVQGVCDFLV